MRALAVGSLAVCLLALPVEAASLADVQERGWIRVCAHPDALPFSSQDRAQPGLQLEIADAIAKVLGVKVVPEWIVFSRSARRAECDAVIGGVVPLTGDHKAPRGRGVLLTRAYAGGGYVLAVPRANTSVHRVEDVKGGKVGVEYTSWPHYLLQTRGVPVAPYASQLEIIEAVASGEAAAGMVTEPYLGWFLKSHPDQPVKVADGYVRDPELQWNVAVRLLNAEPTLRDAVDRALEGLLADRTIPGIFAKYNVTYVPPFKP
jgi:polar amino acid transport system substrate-binding protein